MKIFNSLAFILVCVFFVSIVTSEEKSVEQAPVKKVDKDSKAVNKIKPLVQLALLLDTSGSMSGLIDQAKGELWKIVNEFAFSEQEGERPQVQVALYEYGKSSIPQEQGYLRQIAPLTDDLDRISEELFKLTTNGGSEYCGQVIQAAARELKWSESPKALKTIFIAGNEPFTQGTVNYVDACREAIQKGVTVNTIYCGPEAEGVSTNWKDGSVLADGGFLSINHNQKVAHVPSPFDKEITELGVSLNKTYVPYGSLGAKNSLRQSVQDSNSINNSSGSAVSRAACKASFLYKNSSWDLVDALNEKVIDLKDFDMKKLPKELQKMTKEELKVYLKKKEKERGTIQKKIHDLNQKREVFVKKELVKQGKPTGNTLDVAVLECLKQQGEKKNFKFIKKNLNKAKECEELSEKKKFIEAVPSNQIPPKQKLKEQGPVSSSSQSSTKKLTNAVVKSAISLTKVKTQIKATAKAKAEAKKKAIKQVQNSSSVKKETSKKTTEAKVQKESKASSSDKVEKTKTKEKVEKTEKSNSSSQSSSIESQPSVSKGSFDARSFNFSC